MTLKGVYPPVCERCKEKEAAYLVSAADQPLEAIVGTDQVRLGITQSKHYYLDLGKGPQLVRPLCSSCATAIPDGHKWQLPR